jgi:hypothetical protein
MDLLYSNKFDSFAIVSSDSDFTRLALRLRESSIYVFGIGKKKTPTSFKNSCDDFIIIENFKEDKSDKTDYKKLKDDIVFEPPKKAVKILKDAWEKNTSDDDEQWAYISQSGSYIKRVHPDFDTKTYGAKSYTKLIEMLGEYFEIKDFGKGVMFRPRIDKE